MYICRTSLLLLRDLRASFCWPCLRVAGVDVGLKASGLYASRLRFPLTPPPPPPDDEVDEVAEAETFAEPKVVFVCA